MEEIKQQAIESLEPLSKALFAEWQLDQGAEVDALIQELKDIKVEGSPAVAMRSDEVEIAPGVM